MILPLGLICGGGILVGGKLGGHNAWCSSLGIGGGLPQGALIWWDCQGACGGGGGGKGGPLAGFIPPDSAINIGSLPDYRRMSISYLYICLYVRTKWNKNFINVPGFSPVCFRSMLRFSPE